MGTETRATLAEHVYREIGMSYSESLKIVDLFFTELILGLEKDGVVKIPSFGSFYSNKKNARIGRNPRTKVEVVIQPRVVVNFYASSVLKDKMNKSGR